MGFSKESLRSASGQREQLLKRGAPETWTAWCEIQKRMSEFQQPVFGPPVLNCEVTDMRYAAAIEGLCGNALIAITTQTFEDYRKVVALCFGNKSTNDRGLGLADVVIQNYSRSPAPTLADSLRQFSHNRLSKEDLKANFGFDGYGIDFIKGPDPVINMLCHEGAIHRVVCIIRKNQKSRH